MKKLITIILLTSFQTPVYSDDFEYEKVYVCGPERLEIGDYRELGFDEYKYYFIHFGKDDKFVILHNDIQYTNFRDTIKSQLFYQNGGTFRATLDKVNGFHIFKLVDKESNYVITLNFDEDSLTYMATPALGEKTYKSMRGFCQLEKIEF